MTQVTATNLDKLNTLQLYEHYAALERSLPLLTAESQDVAKAELEACANIRSEKVDRIYYAMAAHEDALERIKKESELVTQAKRSHESQLKSLKGLLSWLRRSLPGDNNKITGKNYQFTLSKKKDLTVEITSDPELWDNQERLSYCIEEEVCTTKRIVLRSLSGEVLEERTEPKTTTKIVPNIHAIRDAYANGQKLPQGVKVFQEYAIRSKRIYGNQRLESETSQHTGQLLPED